MNGRGNCGPRMGRWRDRYIVGTNLIQLLPEYRMLVEQEQSVLKGIEPKSEASRGPQTDPEVRFSELVDADRKMLCRWLHWCPLIAMLTPNDAERTANASVSTDVTHAATDAVVVKSRQMLAVLQGYLLPLLYGWIGATAYVVRSLAREAREALSPGKRHRLYIAYFPRLAGRTGDRLVP